MATPFLLPERLKTSIALGESHFREFKSAVEGPPEAKRPRDKKHIAEDICRTLVGFANADGGELLVGVEDDGRITGLNDLPVKVMDYLENCWRDGVHKDTPLTSVRVSRIEVDGKSVIYFLVSKSTDKIHLTSDGRCLQRRDLETAPVHFEDIQFSRQEQLSRVYDREYISAATIDDLDINAVRILAQHVSSGMSAEKCLQYLGLADFSPNGLQLTRASLLLFSNEIWKWHPRSHVRILKVAGTELKTGESYNVVSDTPVQGNILHLIEETWNSLRPHLTQTKLNKSGKFEASIIYPEAACREALINAIGHRDYSQEGRGIEIFIYDNRIEFKNPGSLLSSLSIVEITKLTGAHQSRNTLIARALRELGYMREVGEGVRRMFELMSAKELEPPRFETSSSTFSVTLTNSLIYTREHLIWLDNFSHLNLVKDEKTVIVLGYDEKPISANDIIRSVGIVDIEDYRKLVHNLQEKGILAATMDRNAAYKYASKNKISRRDVPRFKISVPKSLTAERVGMPVVAADRRSTSRPSKGAHQADAANRASKAAPANERYEVFIGNISRSTPSEDVVALIQDVVPDVAVDWPALRSPIGPKYCAVRVPSKEMAERLVSKMSKQEVDGLKLIARLLKLNG